MRITFMSNQKALPEAKEPSRLPLETTVSGNGSIVSRDIADTASAVATSAPMPDRPLGFWTTALVLLLLSVVSYGPLIPWLGFYWDDWPAMWVLHSLGGEGIKAYTAADRPFLGWLYAVTMPALGESPLSWHLFAIVTRWLSAAAAWWCLRGLWPERPREIAAMACLFTIYPGFTLQPIAWCHSHVFLELGIAVLSLGAMVWAHRLHYWYWPLMITAISSAAVTMMVSEYFVGLELLRPVLLWVVLSAVSRTGARVFAAILKSWLPFVAVLALYLVWRLVLFHPSGVNDQSKVLQIIQGSPFIYLLHRLYAITSDLVEAGIVAWARTAGADLLTFGSIRWVGCGIALAAAAAAGTFWYLKRLDSRSDPALFVPREGSATWTSQAMAVGIVAILTGGLPFWFGNRDIRLDTLADRYTVPVMLGCVVLLAAVSQAMTRKAVRHIAFISLLVGLSVAFHFRNTLQFIEDWSIQKELLWQLSWRVPALKPGTLVLADESVVSFPRSYSFLGPVNFLYAPDHVSAELNYGLFALSMVLQEELPSLAENQPFHYAFRTISFTASTSESLVLWFSPPSCLRVLDPSRDEIPHLPPLAKAAKRISHLDRIVPQPSAGATPPASIFGREPDHSWCYYFQKADLARQWKNWPQVAQIGDEARRLGLAPGDSTEWLPFVEGYLRTGRPAEAEQVLARMVEDIPAVRSVLTVYDVNRVNRRPVLQIVPMASPALCRALEGVGSPSLMTARVGCVVS
jgi:hypothetical protein